MGVVQLSTLSLYLLSISLSFSFFFCSHAAARRQEQHEQTGFLSLAAFVSASLKPHHSPLLKFFFSLNQLMTMPIQNGRNAGKHWPNHSLFSCHNVDSHASKSCDNPPSFSLVLKQQPFSLLTYMS